MRINWALVSGVFLFLAVAFVFNLWGDIKKVDDNPIVDPSFISKEPVRKAMLKPEHSMLGLECMSCHQSQTIRNHNTNFASAHGEIVLEHGGNNRCLNCHHPSDRNKLLASDGSGIGFEKSEMLCGKCHGVQLREWNAGIHGRVSGYWNQEKGEKNKLTCVQCHDPHSPKFKPLKPAPGPIGRLGKKVKEAH